MSINYQIFRQHLDDLSNALLFDGEMYLISRALQHVLGAHVGYDNFGQSAGILFDGNLDKIFEWCENNKDIAPIVLGKMIPIFDKNNSDFSNWNPICKKIIDEYGNNDYVLNSISANMGTYSWTGSSVPLIEHSLKLMQQLANHNINNVCVWATKNISYYEKMLKRENIRDEKRYIH